MLKTCYSPRYYANTHTNSMEKLVAIADVLEQEQLVELIDPNMIDIAVLKQLHDPHYVDAFITGTQPLASMQGFKPWNEQLRDAVLSVQAGQLVAAEIAFKEGIAANIAQGFHHAVYDFGSSYCTFNGLALLAQYYANKKIVILDCDQHGGNGTAEFTLRYKNLYNYSICALPFGTLKSEQSIVHKVDRRTGSAEEFMQALQDGIKTCIAWQPDLLVYQAGMDGHQKDPCGSRWCTTELLYQRDLEVFTAFKQAQIPVLFVMAGGYQSLKGLVPLHINTFRAANEVYF